MSENAIIHSEPRASRAVDPALGLRLWALLAQRPLLTLSLAYTAVWLVFNFWHSVPFASLETDGMEYIETARTLFTSGFTFSSYHGIGYPVAIWLVHLLVSDWFLAARIVSGLAGLVLVASGFLLLEKIAGRGAAIIGSLLMLTNFFVVAYSGMAMADMLGAGLGLLAPLIIIRSNGPSRYVWAGLAAGLAASARYQFLGLAAAVIVVLLLEQDNRARLRAGALYLGAFGLAVLPLFVVNWLTFGNPLFNSNYALVGIWLDPTLGAGPVNSWPQVLGRVVANPRFVLFQYARTIGFDVPLFLIHVVYYSIFFALPGWLLSLKGREAWNRFAVIAAFTGGYLLVTSVGWIYSERYWLYLIPFFSGGAALLISAARSRIGWVLLVVLLAVNLAGAAENWSRFADEQAPEFKRAGEVIRSQAAAADVILVSQPQVGYFADRKNVLWRDAPSTWDALSQVVAKAHIQYVVMDDRYGAGHYPELARLFDPEQVKARFPDWQVVYSEAKSPRIIVYRTGSQ